MGLFGFITGLYETAYDTGKDDPHRLTPQRLARENLKHDAILAGLALVLTFLLASYPVSNSDALLHLRIGELIAQWDEFDFGRDPFSYTVSNETVWVHHGWLSCLVMHGIYVVSGGAGLVLLRGLIALALAVLFLQFRRPGHGLFLYTVATVLGVLVLSQRMFMRPEVIGFLFLGLTLYLLWGPGRPQGAEGWRKQWLALPPIFALWANMDHWFFLGPAVVGLYLLGEVLQDLFSEDTGREDKLSPKQRGVLAGVLLAGLAACLANPYFYRVFQVPGELYSKALETFQAQEPTYRLLGVSPFAREYFRETQWWFRPMQLSFAEWAYYPLVLFGGLSFLLAGRPLRWGRLLVWSAFFLLSAYQARNAAFLAIVTVPVALLNFQERYQGLPSVNRPWVALAQGARAVTLLVILWLGSLLIIAADPTVQALGADTPQGLVHGRGAAGWTLKEDPSWRRAAEQLERWRRQGKLEGNAFHVRLEMGHYLARYVPGKTNFIDVRFALHGESAPEFVHASQSLRQTGTPQEFQYHWQDVFNRFNISHLVIDQLTLPLTSPQRRGQAELLPPVVFALLQDRANWEQLDFADGQTFILAWKKSPHWPKLRSLRYQPGLEAFRRPTQLPPPEGPPRQAADKDALATLLGAPLPFPRALLEAEWHRIMHAQELTMIRGRWIMGPRGQTIEALLGQIAPPAAHTLVGVPLPPLPFAEPFPMARVVLALRAVRRAIAENPEDPRAYQMLYHTYQLLEELEAPPFAERAPGLNPIRNLQSFFALRNWADRLGDQPLRLVGEQGANPHFSLAQRYAGSLFLDLALDEYRRGVAAVRAFGPLPGMNEKQFEQALQNVDRSFFGSFTVEQIERLVRETQAQYRARVSDALFRDNPLARFQVALTINPRCRLAKEALQDLIAAQQLPPEVRRLAFPALLDLCINTGRFADARTMLRNPQAAELLGTRYHEMAGLVSAAYGEYDKALEHLGEVDALLAEGAVQQVLGGFQTQLLGGNADAHGSVALRSLDQTLSGLTLAAQRSDSLAMMGLLAVEAGRVRGGPQRPGAAELFRRAVEVFPDSVFRPIAGHYYFLITGELLDDSLDHASGAAP